MPCDAACVKIIINGRFMAVLAPQVAELWPDLLPSAVKLGIAANTLSDMATARGLTVAAATSDSFHGCAQASEMVRWIRRDQQPYDHPNGAAAAMDEWTGELWAHIADLAAGKQLSALG